MLLTAVVIYKLQKILCNKNTLLSFVDKLYHWL